MKEVNNTFLLYSSSPYSGFTTVAVVEKAQLLSPLYKYILTSLILLTLTCGSVIMVSYFISKRIGHPLKQMYSQIHSFQINANTLQEIKLKEVNTNIIELHTLLKDKNAPFVYLPYTERQYEELINRYIGAKREAYVFVLSDNLNQGPLT